MATLIEVPEGLADVAVAATTVGDVEGERGFYHYRGQNAVELTRNKSFEEVAALVLDSSGRPAIDPAQRVLPASLHGVVGQLDLRSGLALLGAALGCRPVVDIDAAQRRADAVSLISALPTLIASTYLGHVVEPRPELGHAANFLFMLQGREAPIELVRALETYLILTIDHGFNASTFTARVVTSTGTDVAGGVLAGLCALSGPRHGGAPSKVLDMLDAIGSADNAEVWLKAHVASGERIMGFGHRVYRAPDPRSQRMAEVAEQIAPQRYRLAAEVEQVALRLLAGRRLVTNIELYAAVVLEVCGIPRELATPTFAIARCVGWCAHILEQSTESKIIRPAAYYVGPAPK